MFFELLLLLYASGSIVRTQFESCLRCKCNFGVQRSIIYYRRNWVLGDFVAILCLCLFSKSIDFLFSLFAANLYQYLFGIRENAPDALVPSCSFTSEMSSVY